MIIISPDPRTTKSDLYIPELPLILVAAVGTRKFHQTAGDGNKTVDLANEACSFVCLGALAWRALQIARAAKITTVEARGSKQSLKGSQS